MELRPLVHRARYPLLYLAGLLVYGLLAGDRLWHQSADPHYVLQADAWLHGKARIDPPPRGGDDWCKIETVELRDHRVVRGRRMSTDTTSFQTTTGERVKVADIAASRGVTYYVSFPPFPSVIMLPAAAMGGRRGNDVLPTVLCAALVLPLGFATLRRLAAAGQSQRTAGDDLWLTATLAFGTVFFFAAVQGQVWFSAHVIGVVLALGYLWASIEAGHPLVAGACLGLAAITRPPMAFMFPLFVLEAARMHGGLAALRADRKQFVRAVAAPLLRFAIPVIAVAIAAGVYNWVRFDRPGEFGHDFLDVKQQRQMELYGLFSYHYLARNLAVAFTLLPEWSDRLHHVVIGGHGLALWVTTPAFVLLLWPRERPPIHRALWLSVAAVAIPILCYQNTGWFQFGYRFSLDYTPLLVLLLAAGGRRFGWGVRALFVVGICINLFGAWSFNRHGEYYRGGADAYQDVVAN